MQKIINNKKIVILPHLINAENFSLLTNVNNNEITLSSDLNIKKDFYIFPIYGNNLNFDNNLKMEKLELNNRTIIFKDEEKNLQLINKYIHNYKIEYIEIFESDFNLPSVKNSFLNQNNLENLLIRTLPDIILLDKYHNIHLFEIKRKFLIDNKKVIINIEFIQFYYNYLFWMAGYKTHFLITNEKYRTYYELDIEKLLNSIEGLYIHKTFNKVYYLFDICIDFAIKNNIKYKIVDFPINNNRSGDPYLKFILSSKDLGIINKKI